MAKKRTIKIGWLGILLAIVGLAITDIVISHFTKNFEGVLGRNLTLDQIKAYSSLYKYEFVLDIFVVIVFWTFGTCIEILRFIANLEKESNPNEIDV